MNNSQTLQTATDKLIQIPKNLKATFFITWLINITTVLLIFVLITIEHSWTGYLLLVVMDLTLIVSIINILTGLICGIHETLNKIHFALICIWCVTCMINLLANPAMYTVLSNNSFSILTIIGIALIAVVQTFSMVFYSFWAIIYLKKASGYMPINTIF